MSAPTIRVKYKGAWVTFKDLFIMSGVHRKTLHCRWAAAGRKEEITDRLLVKSMKTLRQPAPVAMPPKKYTPPVDRSPGWLERKMFHDAGKNGFQRVEVVNESCLGMMANVPSAGDLP